jgi:hypothetical protein
MTTVTHGALVAGAVEVCPSADLYNCLIAAIPPARKHSKQVVC